MSYIEKYKKYKSKYLSLKKIQKGGDITKEQILENPLLLQYAPDIIKNDEDMIKYVIEKYPLFLRYASERLKNNKNIVKLAIDKDPFAVNYRGTCLQDDKEIVMYTIEKNSYMLKYAGDKLNNDECIVIYAVRDKPVTLQFASERLKNNKNIVMLAIDKDPFTLQYASEQLKDDENIVFSAIIQHPLTLQYASERLKDQEQILKWALTKSHIINDSPLKFTSDRLRNIKYVVKWAIEVYPYALLYASEQLQNDKEIVKYAISIDPSVFQYVSVKLKKDKDFIKENIKNNAALLFYANGRLRRNKLFVSELMDINPIALIYAHENLHKSPDLLEKTNKLLNAKKYKIETTDNLYNTKSYIISEKNKNKWICSQCSPNCKILAKFILDITRYVTNQDFLYKLKESICKIPTHKKYVLFILRSPDEDLYKIKSNYWISAILIDQINKNNLSIEIIDIIYDIKDPKIYFYSFCNIDFIVCDDGSYSGSQVKEEIVDKIILLRNTLYLLIPFISTPAEHNILSSGKNVVLLNSDRIQTVLERCEELNIKTIKLYDDQNILREYTIKCELDLINSKLEKCFPNLRKQHKYDIKNRSMPFYFDHKIGDYVSTFPIIYQFGIIEKDPNNPECKSGNVILIDNCSNPNITYEDLNDKNFDKQCVVPYYKTLTDLKIVEVK